MTMLQFSSKIFAICICLISISGISEAIFCSKMKLGGSEKLPSEDCPKICNYTFVLRSKTFKLLTLNVSKNGKKMEGNCTGQFQIDNFDLTADVDTPRCYVLYRTDCVEPVERGCEMFKVTDSLAKVYIGQEPLSIQYSYEDCTKAPTTLLSTTTRGIKHKITSTYQNISSSPSTFTAGATTTPFTTSAPITSNERLITKIFITPQDISSTPSKVTTKGFFTAATTAQSVAKNLATTTPFTTSTPITPNGRIITKINTTPQNILSTTSMITIRGFTTTPTTTQIVAKKPETSPVFVTTTKRNTILKLITSSESLYEEWTNSKFETNSISDTTAVKDTMSHDITDVVSQVTHALRTTSFSNHTMEGNDENADSRMDTILAIIVPCSIVLLLGVIAVPTLLCLRKRRKLQNQNQSIELHRESTTAVGQSALNLAKKPVNVFEQNSLHEVSSEFDSFSDAQGEHSSSGEMVNNVLYGMV